MKKLYCLLILLVALPAFAQPKLTPHQVRTKDGRTFELRLPADLEIIPAAEGLKRVRFFAKAPDGRVFVTDMFNLTDNKKGVVYILDGWDADKGTFASVTPYMTDLRNPNSCQFYRDADGQDWFYLAETHQLTRRKFTHGETKPTDDKPEVLATFPDYGLSYKYGGWHLTRTIAFGSDGKMYVSVGSSCNACVEKEEVRASVVVMNPDGSDQRELAGGLRNAVSIKWIGNFLWATNQGSDHLGLQKPDETFYALTANPPRAAGDPKDYGWPYCHSSNGRIFADPKFKRPSGCRGVPAPYAYFPSRSSALGFDYFDDADALPAIKDAFLVSLHGSTNKTIGHGYKIVIMRKGEKLQDLVSGFLNKGVVHGRPCDILKIGPNAFLFSDDNKGVIYLVRKKGTSTPLTPRPPASSSGEDEPGTEVTRNSPDKSEIPASRSQPPSSTCYFAILVITAAAIRTVF